MVEAERTATLAAELEQVDRYRFRVDFPGTAYPPITVDEGPPVGAGDGPDPVLLLAAAVGHCMSSTFYNTLERAHVPALPIRTEVRTVVGPNAKGRRRVLRLEVAIKSAPVREEDRERFDHAFAIFEEFCTVSGAVREGIAIRTSSERPVPRAIPPAP